MTHTEESLMALVDEYGLGRYALGKGRGSMDESAMQYSVLRLAIREVLAERDASNIRRKQLLDRAEKAEAECDRLSKDAERYRWLRKYGPNSMAITAYRSASACRVEPHDYATFEEYIDAAIDAAMKEQP